MNQIAEQKGEKQQGIIGRWLTAVANKFLGCICIHEMGMTPIDMYTFAGYCGFVGVEEAMMAQALTNAKWYSEVDA